MQYSWYSVFSFPYIIRPVCRIAWSDSPPCFGPSLFTDAANATAFPYDGRFLRFPAELFVIYSRRIKARTGTSMPSKGMDYLLRLVQLRALLSLSANRSFICSSFCSYNGANIRNILKYRLFTARLLQKNRKTRCVPRFSITPTPAGFTALNGTCRRFGPVNHPYPA